jgi:hypothetical protein
VYRRAAKSASGLSADTIESIDEEVVVEIEMRVGWRCKFRNGHECIEIQKWVTAWERGAWGRDRQILSHISSHVKQGLIKRAENKGDSRGRGGDKQAEGKGRKRERMRSFDTFVTGDLTLSDQFSLLSTNNLGF